ncbi:MAG: 50S ribosomal protein L4, partial [Proteobacteria bacterium]|nr:50S ribosomal protein L4 [Pseudomonadota bacterium]
DHLERSSRNVQGFKVIPTAGLNVYDILLHKHIVLLQPCIGQLEERLLS